MSPPPGGSPVAVKRALTVERFADATRSLPLLARSARLPLPVVGDRRPLRGRSRRSSPDAGCIRRRRSAPVASASRRFPSAPRRSGALPWRPSAGDRSQWRPTTLLAALVRAMPSSTDRRPPTARYESPRLHGETLPHKDVGDPALITGDVDSHAHSPKVVGHQPESQDQGRDACGVRTSWP